MTVQGAPGRRGGTSGPPAVEGAVPDLQATALALRIEALEARVARLEAAVRTLRASLDDMLGHEGLARAGEHREVLEAYRMFANDRGWLKRMRDAVMEGLTAVVSGHELADHGCVQLAH